MSKCVAPPIRLFVEKLREYCPVRVRQVYLWIENSDIDVWPRYGQEQYKIRVNEKLRKFLEKRGVSQGDVENLIMGLFDT
jgi:hypothetical protein